MFKNIGWKFKILLVAIAVVPTLFVGLEAALQTVATPTLFTTETSVDANQPCKAGAKQSGETACIHWTGSGSDPVMPVKLALLVVELGLAVVVAKVIYRSQRLLLLTKMLLVTSAVVASLAVAAVVSWVAFPHHLHATLQAASQGEHRVYKLTERGFDPQNLGAFMLCSVVPALGLVYGVRTMAGADRRAFAGMKKEELFQ